MSLHAIAKGKIVNSSAAWLQRPLALALCLVLLTVLPLTYFDLFANAIFFAHYLAALRFHPWVKIRRQGGLPAHLMVAVALACVGQLLFFYSTPGIILFFGVHFVFTELYESRVPEDLKIVLVRGLYYTSGYLFFMKYNLGLEAFGPPLFLVALASLFLTMLYVRSVSRILFEISFLVPLLLAYQKPMHFSFLISYHVITWWMIPLVRGSSAVPKKYVLESLSYSAFFLVLVFGSYLWRESTFWIWHREVIRFGYIHVTMSFAMSALNPRFVSSGFNRLQGMLRNVV